MTEILSTSNKLMQNEKFKLFMEGFNQRLEASKTLSIDESRRVSAEFFNTPETVFENVYKIENIHIDARDGHKIPLRIYTPSEKTSHDTIIFFHRGGWVYGSIEEADSLCRKLANHWDKVIISVDYRRSPENPFPVPLNDCYDATQWAALNAGNYGGNSRLIVAGESAGGNMAAVVSMMARDLKGPKISAQLLITPVISSSLDEESYTRAVDQYFMTKDCMSFFWGCYLPNSEDRNNPYASPDKAKDFSSLPPALIITASYDALKEEAENYGLELHNAGVHVIFKSYPDVIHGFLDLPFYDNADKDKWIDEIKPLLYVLGL